MRPNTCPEIYVFNLENDGCKDLKLRKSEVGGQEAAAGCQRPSQGQDPARGTELTSVEGERLPLSSERRQLQHKTFHSSARHRAVF